MKAALLLFIRAYKLIVSPFIPKACRFYPSCSVYAEQAITNHGVFYGIFLAMTRIFRCHPFNPGGYDPVPDVSSSFVPTSSGLRRTGVKQALNVSRGTF